MEKEKSKLLQCEKSMGMLQRVCTVNLRGKKEKKYDREERLKKLYACLALCLSLWPLWRLAPN